jgi:hypothetical protein
MTDLCKFQWWEVCVGGGDTASNLSGINLQKMSLVLGFQNVK